MSSRTHNDIEFAVISMAGLSFLDQQLKLNTKDDAAKVIRQIEACQELTFLELKGNTLGIEAADEIAKSLAKHPEIKRALWSDLFTGRLKTEIPPILKSLTSSLMSCGAMLTELDLSDNAFGPIGADGIKDFLSSEFAFALEKLALNNNGLGAGGQIVAKALAECHHKAVAKGRRLSLKTFIAGRNRLENPGARALADTFKLLGSLEEVSVPQNGISAVGIEALADAFVANPHLKRINISDNTCTLRGAHVMAKAIGDLHELEELNVSDCLCTRDGAAMIISVVNRDELSKFRELHIEGNELSADEVFMVVDDWNDDRKRIFMGSNHYGSQFIDLLELIDESGLKGIIDIGVESDNEDTLSYSSDDRGDVEEEEEAEEEEGEQKQPSILSQSACSTAADTFTCFRGKPSLAAGDSRFDHSKAMSISSEEDTMDCFGQKPPNATINVSKDMSVNSPREEADDTAKIFAGMRVCGPLAEEAEEEEVVLSFDGRALKMNTAKDAEEVAVAIEKKTNLTTLILKGNTLGVEAGQRIADALKKCPRIKRCLWSDMFTGRLREEIPGIVKGLGRAMIEAGARIRELDLSDNAFGPIGAESLEELLLSPVASTLEVLRLNNCGLGAGAVSIATYLKKQHELSGGKLKLRVIIAGRNRLELRGAQAFAATIKTIGTIEQIELPQNGIRKEGIIALADGFAANKNLRILSINDNTATAEGAQAIAKAISKLSKLEEVNCGDCLSRDRGCRAIVAAALHLKNLKSVDLSGSELSPTMALDLVEMWKPLGGRGAVLNIGTNNMGESFDRVREAAENVPGVNVGDEDDDQGSLSDGEEEELRSSDSGDQSDDEAGESQGDENILPMLDVQKFLKEPSLVMLKAMAANKENVIKMLGDSLCTRTQEGTASFLLSLCVVLARYPMELSTVIDVAEAVMRHAESVPRCPPTSTQVANHLIAHLWDEISVEEPLVDDVPKAVIRTLMVELVERGRFAADKNLIQYYCGDRRNYARLPFGQQSGNGAH